MSYLPTSESPGCSQTAFRPALLTVDCQLAFTSSDSRSCVAGAGEAVEQIVRLIRLFHGAGLPVAATRHAHASRPGPGGMGSWWRSFIREGTPRADLDPRLPGGCIDRIFTKEHYSAFRGTGLSGYLAGLRVTTLVLCGFQTHICVESTAREAFDAGFDVMVVPEGCSSVGRDLHDAALLCMGNALAHPAGYPEIEARLNRG